MARVDKMLLIAGMDNTIQSFYLKGKKNWSVTITPSSEIVGLIPMDSTRSDQA